MKRWIKSLQQTRVVKSIVYFVVGVFSYPGLAIINRIKITGTENIKNLPKKNVLFVSNHQTYFADVITFLHIFCAVKWRKQNRLGIPFYLLNPFTRVYFVAAAETMKSSWLSQTFRMGRGYHSKAHLAGRRKRSTNGDLIPATPGKYPKRSKIIG